MKENQATQGTVKHLTDKQIQDQKIEKLIKDRRSKVDHGQKINK